MAQEHQRASKVTAYVGFWGGLGIAATLITNPPLLIAVGVAFGALAYFKPEKSKKILTQTKNLIKDILSHIREDLGRVKNKLTRKSSKKSTPQTASVEAPSSLGDKESQCAFNATAQVQQAVEQKPENKPTPPVPAAFRM